MLFTAVNDRRLDLFCQTWVVFQTELFQRRCERPYVSFIHTFISFVRSFVYLPQNTTHKTVNWKKHVSRPKGLVQCDKSIRLSLYGTRIICRGFWLRSFFKTCYCHTNKNGDIFAALLWTVSLYRVGQKSGPFLKVHNCCIWWHRKAINIPKCSALYRE